MTDIEMTKLCAEAIGVRWIGRTDSRAVADHLRDQWIDDGRAQFRFDPLHNDAQAMALVKRFNIRSHKSSFGAWCCAIYGSPFRAAAGEGRNDDLNRAIVECVAKMQSAISKDAAAVPDSVQTPSQ